MIEYIEIRNQQRELIGIIDTAQSVIWHATYYGVGDFEIYCRATSDVLALLKEDYYITLPDDENIGLIESVIISDDPLNGRMVTASGHFAKIILQRRHIYNLSAGNYSNKVTVLRGNVEQAVRGVVRDNIIACNWNTRRNIDFIVLGEYAETEEIIIDDSGDPAEKQVSYDNLLDYTDSVLMEYFLGSKMLLDAPTKKLKYLIYKGADRSIDNADGNQPIIFSRDFDNLATETYSLDKSMYKNMAIIGGAGEGAERFYTITGEYAEGVNRFETFVDARSISKTYTDDETGEDVTYTDAEYAQILKSEGKQTIAAAAAVESLSGELDLTLSPYIYGKHFLLGDIVTVESVDFKRYINARITDVTQVQDENGYTLSVSYEN